MRILVMAVLLVMMGCGRTPLPSSPASGPNTPVSKDVAVAARPTITAHRLTTGEVLYIRHCAGCHGAGARGDGAVGKALEVQPKNLRNADLLRNSDDELIVRILHGKTLPVPVNPQAFPSSEEEISALLAHLRRLPTLSWGQIEAGESVYDSLCLTCHGIYGHGDGSLTSTLPVPPRDLSAPLYQQQVSDDELLKVISEGKGAMPGSGDVLSLDDRKAVVTFIRVLSPGYELYDRYCVSCHGTKGRAPDPVLLEALGFPSSQKTPPSFDRAYFQQHTDEQLRPKVTHMLKLNRVAMPHFAGELTAEQVREIVKYLRTLSPES
jgi:mono/diheme cytochrome c family protein